MLTMPGATVTRCSPPARDDLHRLPRAAQRKDEPRLGEDYAGKTAPGLSPPPGRTQTAPSKEKSGQWPGFFLQGRLNLPDEFRFQLHRANAVDLAIDVVVAVHQADVLSPWCRPSPPARSLPTQVPITVMVSPSWRTLPTESLITLPSSDAVAASFATIHMGAPGRPAAHHPS